MKKHLLAIYLLAIFVSSGSIYAGQKSGGSGTTNQVQQQNQVTNQGESIQIQTEINEQAQQGTPNNQNPNNNGMQIQQQDQQRIQDGTGEGSQIRNQEGVSNNQVQNNQSGVQQKNQSDLDSAQLRRSQVANAVQEMIQVADRSSGVGEQIRAIAQTQNQNQENIEASLEKVQSRSGLLKFLIGSDYVEISNTQQILEQNQEQLQQLNQIKNQLTSESDQQALGEQIQLIEQINAEIKNTLENSQKGFSLLGWAFKLFSK